MVLSSLVFSYTAMPCQFSPIDLVGAIEVGRWKLDIKSVLRFFDGQMEQNSSRDGATNRRTVKHLSNGSMDLVTVMDCPLTFNCSAFVLCEQRCPTGNYLSTVILRAAGSLDFS